MKKKYSKSLPVLMHHYISNSQSSIAVSPELFEQHCSYLAQKGWRGISLLEAEAFFLDQEELAEKTFLFTFDDGYLDNYLFAQTIMHAYGHQGVMFAVSKRLEEEKHHTIPIKEVFAQKMYKMDIDKSSISSHTIELSYKALEPIEKNAQGMLVRKDLFCNKEEAQNMHKLGVLSVAAHSYEHLGVFTGPHYKELYLPKNQKRTFYLTSYGEIWGLPLFDIGPGLAHRAFLPNPKLIEMVKQFVPQDREAASSFFQEKNNLEELTARLKSFADDMGRFESDQEMQERMWKELFQGKKSLEEMLGSKVQSLCWPWGAYNQDSLSLAKDAGYKLFFTTKEGANPQGNSLGIRRFKVKSLSPRWLHKRLKIYSRPYLGSLYAKIRI